MESLAKRVREYAQQVREERGDVVMGCVRLECQTHFLGIVFEKPGGSSAQFEACYDPDHGYVMLTPDGEAVAERDPDQVFERFKAVIEAIPTERRLAIERKIGEWRAQGLCGGRLAAMVMSFNTHYDGTRGGEMAPEEMRYAAKLAAARSNGKMKA